MSSPFEEDIVRQASETDEELMRRFQADDEQAFQTLFNRYAARLINFAHRSLHSYEEAQDIAQEVLLRVYRQKDRFDAKRPFKPWIFAIAVRLISNRLRDRKRHPQASLDLRSSEENQTAEALNIPDKSLLSPEDDLEKKKLRGAVWKALDDLPEAQRIAVVLARFEEMSYEEIALTLDTSVSSVKSLVYRARQTLKENLTPYVFPKEETKEK